MLIDGGLFWELKASNGIPLDILIEELCEKDIYPTWDKVLLAAKADGANIDKLVRQLVFYFENMQDQKTGLILKSKIESLYSKMVENEQI